MSRFSVARRSAGSRFVVLDFKAFFEGSVSEQSLDLVFALDFGCPTLTAIAAKTHQGAFDIDRSFLVEGTARFGTLFLFCLFSGYELMVGPGCEFFCVLLECVGATLATEINLASLVSDASILLHRFFRNRTFDAFQRIFFILRLGKFGEDYHRQTQEHDREENSEAFHCFDAFHW